MTTKQPQSIYSCPASHKKDDDFVDMLLEFISGRVNEKQMTEKIESIIKEIKLHE
nr:MAG TPA: hypothetical protein [Caudoviricetes sp.]